VSDDLDAELLREVVYALIRRGAIDADMLGEVQAKFERLAAYHRGSTRRARYEALAHRAAMLPLEATTEDEAQFAAAQRRARIRPVPDGGN
jgi:hypothetical protein